MTLWTPARRRLLELLEAKDVDLGAMYAGVVDLLDDQSRSKGSGRQRVVMCAHGVRELVNNLTDVLGVPIPRSDTSEALRELASAWESENDTLGEPDPQRFETEPDDLLTVRSRFLAKVALAVARKQQGSLNKTMRHSAALLGRRAPRTDPTLRTWLDAYEWFEGHAHLDRSRRREVPALAALVAHLEILEDTLSARLRGFFDVVADLSTLLEQANAEVSDGGVSSFRTPDNELITYAMTRIGDLTHRRAFYNGLKNPKWVEALYERGAFAEVSSDYVETAVRVPAWPEGDYLLRMAAAVPEAVAAVLRGRINTNNSHEQHVLLHCIRALPVTSAANFVKTICAWLNDGGFVDHEPVVELTIRFARAGNTAAARKLADASFAPRPVSTNLDDSARRFRRHQIVTGVEGHWYGQALESVATELVSVEPRFVAAVAMWLEQFQVFSGSFKADTRSDTSAGWRPSIRPHEQNWHHEEIGDPLVETLRSLALSEFRAGSIDSTMRVLLYSGQPLLTRVALDVMAEFVAQEPLRWSDIESLVPRFLEPRYLEDPYRRETVLLLRSALPKLPSVEREALTTAVMTGPVIDDDELGNLLARFDGNLESGEGSEEAGRARVFEFRARWRWRLLFAIGREVLQGELAEEMERLETKLGIPEHPEFDHWHEFHSFPVGTANDFSFSQADDREILELLRESLVAVDEPRDPLSRQYEHALEVGARSDGSRFVHLARNFDDFWPSYLLAVLRGIEHCVQEGGSIDWGEVLSLISGLARQSSCGGHEVGEDVSQRQSVLRQATSLLSREDAVSAWSLDDALSAVATLNELLRRSVREVSADVDNLDSMTKSLNRVRPLAIRALLQIACSFLDCEAGSRSLETLDEFCGPAVCADFSIAAVWGEKLGRLIDCLPNWITPRLRLLLGDPGWPQPEILEYAEIVWSIFLAGWRPHRVFLERLQPWFARAVEDLATDRVPLEGWATQRDQRTRLGDYLLHSVVIGLIDSDDRMIVRYFELAPTEMRADVLGHLGWSLMNAEMVDSFVLSRATEFLSQRAEVADDHELDQCAWWARVPGIDQSWWLPLLRQATVSVSFANASMLGESLEAAAPSDPDGVLEVFERLLDHQERDGAGLHTLFRHAPAILAAAMDHSDESSRRAHSVRDRLGREGLLRLPEQIDEYRRADGDGGSAISGGDWSLMT